MSALYHCETCGSPRVQINEWRDANTGQWRGTGDGEWCDYCQSETTLGVLWYSDCVWGPEAIHTAAVEWAEAYHARQDGAAHLGAERRAMLDGTR